jgi:predicted dehydrogenase
LKEVKVAVVGTGDWGKNLVRNFHKLSALAAVCDLNNLIADQMAAKYKVKNLAWQQILDSSEITAVALSNNRSHYQFAKEALLANKHVFVEKPLAPNVQQAKELHTLAKSVNKVLMVGHLLHYHPAFISLKKLCSSGMLGDIKYAYSNRLDFGKFMPEEDVILNFASHDISMMLSLMGKPKSIISSGNDFLINNIADHALLKLTFANHTEGHIFASWFHPLKERKFVVIGSQAMAVFDDLDDWPQKLCLYHQTVDIHDNVAKLRKLQPEFIAIDNIVEPLYNELNHFIQSIKTNQTPHTDSLEALEVLKIVEQASKQLQLSQKYQQAEFIGN